MEAFLLGATLGLAAGISPGPLLALVIREAINKGATAGILAATAPLITDSWAVFLAWTLGAALPGWAISLIQIIGGIYIIYLGVIGLRSPISIQDAHDSTGSLRAAVLMNLTNPHMYVFWFLVGAPLLHQLRGSGISAFLLGFYLLIVGSKMSLAVLAAKLRHTPVGPASALVGNLALIGIGAYLLLTCY